MEKTIVRSAKWILAASLALSAGALHVAAQVNTAASRITQAINNSDLVTLRGNVHPLALPQYDRGLAPASLAMNHMMLLLKRSPQQEAALEKLLAEQQDRNSPNYHHWLTPAQFGAEFGPSDQDIQKIEGWLESEGFAVLSVSKGRTMIEFSGSAGEVQNAFHIAMHRYVLPDGEQHWSNATNPEIPAALAPVVSGIHGLTSFFPKPLSRIVREERASQPASQGKPQPAFTFASSAPCSAPQQFGLEPSGYICLMVTPADFATIYNINPLYSAGINGTGETIAIANDSNINVSDVTAFRSIMGLPAKTPNVVLADGTDPGLTADEGEAVLDAEWSGAVAKNATIDLVIAPSSNTSFGGDIASEYIVDNDLAPILSYSFGACEAALIGTSTDNSFYNMLWQQGAAEGITVLVAAGDDGSAACDSNVTSATKAEPAVDGLQVNGLASTPYDVAVGGTDFDDTTNPGAYWYTNDSSSTSTPSAKGYIAETAWNESCTNAIFSTSPVNANLGNAATPEEACNNATLASDGFVVPNGGSGGMSGSGLSGSGSFTGYPKPCWQMATLTPPCTLPGAATPSDGARDLPDVSLFAGTGAISASFYYLCESDLSNPPATCSLNGTIYGVGGTSVSAQVFAGIVALIDQKAGAPQGNIDPVLYNLAGQAANVCPTSSPTASCMFYDVTTGTNAMPCAYSSNAISNSPNCFAQTSTDTIGILGTSVNNFSYNAGTGYDLATGLGSVNATNLASAPNAWAAPSSGTPDFSLSSSNPTVTFGSNNSGTMSVTIAPQNGFTGTVNLSCPALPTGDTCSFNPTSPVTINGSTNVTVTVSGSVSSVPGRMDAPAGPAGGSAKIPLILAFAGLALLLLFGLRLRRGRWNTALALAAFALFVLAGCSGSGSTSNNNGGGSGGGGSTSTPFTTSLTATTCTTGAGCTTGITHSLVFTVQ